MTMRFTLPCPDIFWLILSLAVAIASWVGYGIAAFAKPAAAGAGKPGASYVASEEPWHIAPSPEWKSPRSGFDMFAPPRPPVAEPAVKSGEVERFGIELVAIRPEPFCVRLLGIVGDGVERRGVFEDISSGEVRLGRPGDTIPGRVRIQSIEDRGRVASSVVQALDTGRSVELSAGSPAYGEGRIATIREAETTREVRVGERVADRSGKYEIERITESTVTLRREAMSGSASEWRELQLPRTEERP